MLGRRIVVARLGHRHVNEPCLSEAIEYVPAVDPHVVLLSEDTQPLSGIDDASVLERIGAILDGMLENGETAGPEHPPKLPHCRAVVGDVLENVVADDDVEARIRLGDGSDVAMLHRMRRIEVHAQVFDRKLLQALSQPWLWRDVEDPSTGRNPGAKPQPENAMAFERAAVWAARLGPAAMRGEPPRRSFAHRTPNIVACVANTVSVDAGTDDDRHSRFANQCH